MRFIRLPPSCRLCGVFSRFMRRSFCTAIIPELPGRRKAHAFATGDIAKKKAGYANFGKGKGHRKEKLTKALDTAVKSCYPDMAVNNHKKAEYPLSPPAEAKGFMMCIAAGSPERVFSCCFKADGDAVRSFCAHCIHTGAWGRTAGRYAKRFVLPFKRGRRSFSARRTEILILLTINNGGARLLAIL